MIARNVHHILRESLFAHIVLLHCSPCSVPSFRAALQPDKQVIGEQGKLPYFGPVSNGKDQRHRKCHFGDHDLIGGKGSCSFNFVWWLEVVRNTNYCVWWQRKLGRIAEITATITILHRLNKHSSDLTWGPRGARIYVFHRYNFRRRMQIFLQISCFRRLKGMVDYFASVCFEVLYWTHSTVIEIELIMFRIFLDWHQNCIERSET
jgi:hypothetical protein